MSSEKSGAGWDAVQIAPGDNVAVALRDLDGTVRVRQGRDIASIALAEPIPLGHKFALSDLAEGSEVRKHGAPIGRLTRLVSTGEHIHVHNLKSQRALTSK